MAHRFSKKPGTADKSRLEEKVRQSLESGLMQAQIRLIPCLSFNRSQAVDTPSLDATAAFPKLSGYVDQQGGGRRGDGSTQGAGAHVVPFEQVAGMRISCSPSVICTNGAVHACVLTHCSRKCSCVHRQACPPLLWPVPNGPQRGTGALPRGGTPPCYNLLATDLLDMLGWERAAELLKSTTR